MPNKRRIFDFLAQAEASNQRAALVVVTDVTGASVRNPGAMMAVREDGVYTGSLSGGCIEAAIVAAAQEVMASGKMRSVHYGAGSPIVDIRLPCGGAVKILIAPMTSPRFAEKVLSELAARREFGLALQTSVDAIELQPNPAATSWVGETFNISLVPMLRINIFGHGGSVEALASQSQALDCEIVVLTPDVDIVSRLSARGVPAHMLVSAKSPPSIASDCWSANIFYFHDHDWEVALMKAVLDQPSLFVGAMGSRITHAQRLAALEAAGGRTEDLERIVSPVGLIPSSRDPETLALSTLAQIVSVYNQALAGRV